MSDPSPVAPVDGLDLRCPACAATGRPLRLVVDPGCRLVRCRQCATQYLRRLPGDPAAGTGAEATDPGTDSEYWEQYKFDVYGSEDVRRGYHERYDLGFAMVRSRIGQVGSVLDVGCGIGNFLDWATRQGLEAVGVDVDAGAVATVRGRGLAAALPEDLDSLLGGDGTTDVVTMWDVVEHVYDPAEFVGSFVPRLRPGGALLLETPDAAFPVRAVFRALHHVSRGRIDFAGSMYYWEHKVYFTEEGLRRLLAAHGCEVLAVRRLTSPRAKMQHEFAHRLETKATVSKRLLSRWWPVTEAVFRRLGWGNKLIVLARRRPDDV